MTFIEQPRDVRSLPQLGLRRWTSRLAGHAQGSNGYDVEVIERTTFVPAHCNTAAQAADSVLLRRLLRPHDLAGVTVVATTPWQWPAMSQLAHARKVFDCADDWTILIPRRRDAIVAMLDRIGTEADAIVAANERLSAVFARRKVTVVPNAVDDRLLASRPAELPRVRTMAYAGTLSERLDTELLSFVLSALPDWRLELYGECRYAGRRDQPAPELVQLLADFPDRIACHGIVLREELAARLDEARVLLLPHRPAGAIAGDSMKLYDYAARGRPIVSTVWADDLRETGPPGMHLANSGEQFAEAVRSAYEEDPHNVGLRRAWAEKHRWGARWEAWAEAVFGA